MRLKYLPLLVVGLLASTATSFAETPSENSRSRVATIEARCDDARPEVRRTFKFYPADEVYFGDRIYVLCEEENCSKTTINDWQVYSSEDGVVVASKEIATSCEIIPETGTSAWIDFAPQFRDLLSGEKITRTDRVIELAPLDDWNCPFWKELREKLRKTPGGVLCKIGFKNAYRDKTGTRQAETVAFDIVVKPRPDGEMELLQQWFDATPPELFPIVQGARKIPRNDVFIKSSGKSDIQIGGKSYSPWLFVKIGNRKPSDPNNPTTVDGWRELETKFAPSTLRDEITATRLQLEYYDANDDKAANAVIQAGIDWLSQLPEPQRRVTTGAFRNNELQLTPLEAKNVALNKALDSAFSTKKPTLNDAK
ncbi:MAG: hypothetical protein IKU86_06855 [Thermoguttaceae bacterium]|nr:hypothetical protein [Thermoguttaceae bacterium]